MICDVTLMYSLKLFLNFNGWETGWVDFLCFFKNSFFYQYLSSQTWISTLASLRRDYTRYGVVQEEFCCLHQTPSSLFRGTLGD